MGLISLTAKTYFILSLIAISVPAIIGTIREYRYNEKLFANYANKKVRKRTTGDTHKVMFYSIEYGTNLMMLHIRNDMGWFMSQVYLYEVEIINSKLLEGRFK